MCGFKKFISITVLVFHVESLGLVIRYAFDNFYDLQLNT